MIPHWIDQYDVLKTVSCFGAHARLMLHRKNAWKNWIYAYGHRILRIVGIEICLVPLHNCKYNVFTLKRVLSTVLVYFSRTSWQLNNSEPGGELKNLKAMEMKVAPLVSCQKMVPDLACYGCPSENHSNNVHEAPCNEMYDLK